jgi:hypothetical protein
MRRFSSLALVLVATVALSRVAPAQDNTPKPNGTTAATTAPTDSTAAPASTEPAAPKNITGYGYGNTTTQQQQAPVTHSYKPHPKPKVVVPVGPIATLPGFEMQADGSSRFFVQLTATVPVEEKKAAGSITYVLKGAHVNVRNNENALVTVHFNTPVSRARLVPSAQGLSFIIELRAAATPTYKVVAGKDGTSILEVDFPKGSYVTAADGRQAP